MNPIAFDTFVQRNEQKPCAVSGCSKPRSRVSPYCMTHARRSYVNGHPQGRRILPREYADLKAQVRGVLLANPDHPAVVSSSRWLLEWLQGAAQGNTTLPAAAEMARLHAGGVSPLDILTEAAALFAFSRHRPKSLPDDARLTYALSVGVLSLIPREKRYSCSGRLVPQEHHADARREIGKRLRDCLGPLLLNLADSLDKRVEAEAAFLQALRTPFESQRLAATLHPAAAATTPNPDARPQAGSSSSPNQESPIHV